MKRLILSAAVLAALGTLGVGAAMASEKCSAPRAEWQSPEALQQKLESEGWKVKSIKADDGCYEAYAVDPQGRRVEAYFDPKTLEIVKLDDED